MFDWVMITTLSVTITTNLFLSENEDVDEIDSIHIFTFKPSWNSFIDKKA